MALFWFIWMEGVGGFLGSVIEYAETVTVSGALDFFLPNLSVLSQKASAETGPVVLLAIRHVLEKRPFLEVFVQNQLLLRLPFNREELVCYIFPILNEVACEFPEAFNSKATELFAGIMEKNPSSALCVLGNFGKRFDRCGDSSWPMVDLLFERRSLFRAPELAVNYVKLLAFMCAWLEFRRAKAEESWNVICEILEDGEVVVKQACYEALFAINTVYTDGKFPLNMVKRDMLEEELVYSVLALMAVKEVHPKLYRDQELVGNLLKLAKTNKKATLILLQLAQDRITAQLILSDRQWMREEIPGKTDVLKLVMAVFRHGQLRNECSRFEEFIPMLVTMSRIQDSDVMMVICVLVRKLDLTYEFLETLEKQGFFKSFFGTIVSVGTNAAHQALLSMLETLAQVGYIDVIRDMFTSVFQILKAHDGLSESAAMLCVSLLKYQQLREEFREIGLKKFFKQHENDKQIGKAARKFLRQWKTRNAGARVRQTIG